MSRSAALLLCLLGCNVWKAVTKTLGAPEAAQGRCGEKGGGTGPLCAAAPRGAASCQLGGAGEESGRGGGATGDPSRGQPRGGGGCDPRGWGAFVSGGGCRRPHCAAPSLLPSLPPCRRSCCIASISPGSPPAAGPEAAVRGGGALGGAARAPRLPSVGPPGCGLAPFPRGWPGGSAPQPRDVSGPRPGLLFGAVGWGSRGRRLDGLSLASTSGVGAGAPVGQDPSTPGCRGGAPSPCGNRRPPGPSQGLLCPTPRRYLRARCRGAPAP